MQALGCYGSLLAYDSEAKRCQGCSHAKACKAEVSRIRPVALRLLDKFPRVEGGTVGDTWRTASEKKEKRQQDAALAARLVQRVTYNDGEIDNLRKQMNKAANKLLDQAIEDRIDVLRDPIEKIIYLSKPTRAFFERLEVGACNSNALTISIQSKCGISVKTAETHMKKIRSLFLGAKRITENNGMIALA